MQMDQRAFNLNAELGKLAFEAVNAEMSGQQEQ